jgi:hypothetical protein
MFDTYSDGGRRKRVLGRTLLMLVAVGSVGYAVYTVSPRLYGVAPPRPRVIVRSQPAADALRAIRRDPGPPRFAQGGFGGFGGQDLALVARFDKDGGPGLWRRLLVRADRPGAAADACSGSFVPGCGAL